MTNLSFPTRNLCTNLSEPFSLCSRFLPGLRTWNSACHSSLPVHNGLQWNSTQSPPTPSRHTSIFFKRYLFVPVLICPKHRCPHLKNWAAKEITREKQKHAMENLRKTGMKEYLIRMDKKEAEIKIEKTKPNETGNRLLAAENLNGSMKAAMH